MYFLKVDLKNKYIIQLADQCHSERYRHEKTAEKKSQRFYEYCLKYVFETQILIFQLQTL